MLKKNRLMIFILICILLLQPVYAASGTIKLSSQNSVKEYTYYKVFDVTTENKVGWRRLWCVDGYEGCTFECDVVFYGANEDNGKGKRDDEAELLSNHKASFLGIDNRHARTSTYQVVDDERTSIDGDLIWEDGKITISDDEEPTLHYFMYRGSPWIKVVRRYSKKENSGVSLKACKSPYNGGETGLYLVTFDEDIFDEAKFEKYLYNNIPSDALLSTSTQNSIKDVPLGYYIVKAEYTSGEIEYVGNVKLTEDGKTVSLKDNNTLSSTNQATITVYYEDENGNSLLPSETFEQEIGMWYEMTPRSIPGYETNDYPENYQGWCYGNMTVTFTYSPKTIQITARYLDEFGNQIAEPVTISKKYTENYQTEQKVIAGYRLKNVVGNTNRSYFLLQYIVRNQISPSLAGKFYSLRVRFLVAL